MRELNIAGVDLNLLPPLAALLTRRSVTLAAHDVGLSQPAMSRALARLRTLLGDPLLVRGSKGLVPTPRGRTLLPQVVAALDATRAMFREDGFDPAQMSRTVRIAASDASTSLLIPALMSRLARQAPRIDLRIVPYTPDLLERMEAGAVDFAFALASTPLPPGTMSLPLTGDRLTLVTRVGHPLVGQAPTLADYGRYAHVAIALLGDGRSDLDTILAASGIHRRIALVTPYFSAALATVATTDMMTTISAAFAKRFTGTYDLALHPVPFTADAIETTLVWSHIQGADPLLAWFRTMICEVSAQCSAA